MKQTLALLSMAGLFLVSLGGTGHAGQKNDYPVVVNSTTRTVTGSLGTARNSSSPSGLSCKITAIASTGLRTLRCDWRSTTSVLGSCSSTSSALITTAQSISGDSYLSIKWDADGKCTELEVMSSSAAEPKQP